MRVFIVFILFCIQSLNLYSNEYDSLFKTIKGKAYDTTVVNNLILLAEKYENENLDSALNYYEYAAKLAHLLAYTEKSSQIRYRILTKKAYALRNIGIIYTIKSNYDYALEYYFYSLRTYSQINNLKGKTQMFRYIGIGYYYKGDLDLALKYYKYGMNFAIAILDTIELTNLYNNIAIIYHKKRDYKKAMDFYIKQMKLLEHSDNKRALSASYINLGNLYKDQQMTEEALKYYFKAIPIKKELNDDIGIADTYNNIGNVYYRENQFDSAFKYYNLAFPIYKAKNNLQGISTYYANIGMLYVNQKNYSKALEYLLKSEEIDKNNGDQIGELLVYDGIAYSYIKLSDSTNNPILKKHYLTKAKEYAFKLESVARAKNLKYELYLAYKNLCLISVKLKESDLTNKYFELYEKYRDSVYSESTSRLITEMQTKYETEKKELQIEKLQIENQIKQLNLEKSEQQRKHQKMILLGLVVVFIIVVAFSFVVLRLYVQLKATHKIVLDQKQQIEQKNNDLLAANEEIRIQKEEIEAQRDLVVIQKQQIEEYNKKLTDSIVYAQNIQNAVLPKLDTLKKITANYFEFFLIYKPKDIISGDFYWTTRVNNTLIFVVADCTGHGVPGALMSMLGISLLNEIVRRTEVTTTSKALELLREGIINALQQKGEQSEQKDGMDICMIAYDIPTSTIQFSGANSDLYIISKHNLEKIKGDNMPIAIYEKMKTFSYHTRKIFKEDILYLTTDGIKDQFGGHHGKKFLSKRLEQTLLAISSLSMEEQKNQLLTTLYDWQHNYGATYEQTDDITILGLKLC